MLLLMKWLKDFTIANQLSTPSSSRKSDTAAYIIQKDAASGQLYYPFQGGNGSGRGLIINLNFGLHDLVLDGCLGKRCDDWACWLW
jgi:hypothetical protein